jgi:hypothetical protein
LKGNSKEKKVEKIEKVERTLENINNKKGVNQHGIDAFA